jgi:hypothetical protein
MNEHWEESLSFDKPQFLYQQNSLRDLENKLNKEHCFYFPSLLLLADYKLFYSIYQLIEEKLVCALGYYLGYEHMFASDL